MDRRQFVGYAGVSLAGLGLRARAMGREGKESEPAVTMPADFVGLSYESAQLADPSFFSAENATLVRGFRELNPRGVLRLGGNLSDVTLWKGTAASSIAPEETAKVREFYEWRLTDQKAASQRPATLGPEGIAALGGFLRATGWKVIYGFNLGTGTPERAAEEAALVAQHMGEHLLAFQVGNEADLYKAGFRPADWDFDRYWDDYRRYVQAVRARVPRAPFAGPDVAVKVDWVTQFAARAKGDVLFVSSHYYAMGPAGAPGINAAKLLSDDPRIALDLRQLSGAAKTAGVPWRMTEGNTCFHGGQPGVSDTFASALWAADYLLRLAQGGCAGANLHSGGEGYYSPITGEPGATRLRPEYYGMLLAQRFAGATFGDSLQYPQSPSVSSYVARKGDTRLIAVINKSGSPVRFSCPFKSQPLPVLWPLRAPTLDAKEGASFGAASGEVCGDDVVTVSRFSGMLWEQRIGC